MEEFKTGAVRDCGGKGRMDLLPACAILRVAKHMEDAIAPDPETGKPHYPERDWEKGMPIHCMLDSAVRHLMKYLDGWTDEDHLCAAATNLLMAMWTEERKPEMQDIPARMVEVKDTPSESPNAPKDGVPGQMSIDDISRKKCGYYVSRMGGRCMGTKNMERCDCGGDVSRCEIYAARLEGASIDEIRRDRM